MVYVCICILFICGRRGVRMGGMCVYEIVNVYMKWFAFESDVASIPTNPKI